MKKSTLAPRNGHVAAMRVRASGAHGKTKKAIRKAEKQALRKKIMEHHDGCRLHDLFFGAPDPAFQ